MFREVGKCEQYQKKSQDLIHMELSINNIPNFNDNIDQGDQEKKKSKRVPRLKELQLVAEIDETQKGP